MKISMLKEALPAFRMLEGPFSQLYKNLLGKNGEKWFREFNRFLRKEPAWTEQRKFSKKLILSTELLYLDTKPGRYLIENQMYDLSDTNHQDLDFLKLEKRQLENFSISSHFTEEESIEVLPYRFKEDHNYRFEEKRLLSFFLSFGCRLDDLCFSLNEIGCFLENHPNSVAEKFEVGIFLIKKNMNRPARLTNIAVVYVEYMSRDMNHPREYILNVTGKDFENDMEIEGSNNIIFIPKKFEHKKWYLRLNAWLINLAK